MTQKRAWERAEMLIQISTFEQLDFPRLMEVYIEGNRENAEYFYGKETPEKGLQLAVQDARDYLRNDFFQKAAAKYYIWQEAGEYVSALRLERYGDGLLLEALETRPDLRRRGYGRKLIAAVLAQLPQGTHLYSHVAKWNTPSLAIHNACGFSQHLNYSVESDGTISNDHVTFRVTV